MNQLPNNTPLTPQKASLFGKTSIGSNRNFDLEVIHSNHATPASEVESDIYFYHTDHLGSSSWITYSDGSVTQHLQNLLFGEPFIDQRATSYDIRYKFTGKEMDSETGYQYFGARYYDSGLSVWLSVDQLADKYPSMSSYMYTAGNPVMLIDPDGRKIRPTNDESKGRMWSAIKMAFRSNGAIESSFFNFNEGEEGSGIVETKYGMKGFSRRQFYRELRRKRREVNRKHRKNNSDFRISSFSKAERQELYRLYKVIDSDLTFEVGFLSPETRIVGGAVENSNLRSGHNTRIASSSENMNYVIDVYSTIEQNHALKDNDGNYILDDKGRFTFNDNLMSRVVKDKEIFLENLTSGRGYKRFSNGDLLIDYSSFGSTSKANETFVKNIGN